MKKLAVLGILVMMLFTGTGMVSKQEVPLPGGVGSLLCQKLESEGKNPGALLREEAFLLGGGRYILPFEGGELELFAYSDCDQAARELLEMNRDELIANNAADNWSQSSRFFLRDNVIVLYAGEDQAVLQLLEQLCGPRVRAV